MMADSTSRQQDLSIWETGRAVVFSRYNYQYGQKDPDAFTEGK
jgi:hypothetical protein